MPRMNAAQLAAQELEGSPERIDAIRAARRRILEKNANPPKPADHDALDRIVREGTAKERAAFAALIDAIDNADTHDASMGEMMKKVARAALKKSWPQHAELETEAA